MSNYVGKSPISLEQGIRAFNEYVAFLKDFHGEPSTVYKTYEEVFEKVVRDVESDISRSIKGGAKTVNISPIIDYFFQESANNSEPKPPKDMIYSHIRLDLIAYFEGCGYMDVIINPVTVYNPTTDEFVEWDDAWGVPMWGGTPGKYFTLPEGLEESSGTFTHTGRLTLMK